MIQRAYQRLEAWWFDKPENRGAFLFAWWACWAVVLLTAIGRLLAYLLVVAGLDAPVWKLQLYLWYGWISLGIVPIARWAHRQAGRETTDRATTRGDS